MRAKKPVLILVHGDTEREYLVALQELYEPKGIALNIEPNNQSHHDMWRQAKKRAKNEGFYITAAIRDVDFDPNFADLAADARDNATETCLLCCSNPCFEYWLLLHHTESNAPFVQHAGRGGCSKEAVAALKKYEPFRGYQKAGWRGHHSLIGNHLADACQRAKRLAQLSDSEKYEGNPSSFMFELIAALDQLADE